MSILLAVAPGSISEKPEAGAAYGREDYDEYINQLEQTLTAPQRQVYEANERFKLLCSGRRFGKTYLCITRLLNWALEKPGSLNWYVTANYRMAKQIAWRQLKDMAPKELVVKMNESDLGIEFVNGSRIELRGADNEDSLRGVSLSALVIDEAAYVKRSAWEMVLRPALSDQMGPAWFITTPAGLNWFHELWEQAQEEIDWSTFSFTTIEGGNVSVEEVAAAKRTLDERTFKQEYLASFETLSGRCFPDFDDGNITDTVRDVGGPILVGLDFNVGVMAGCIASKVGDQLHIWDDISVKNSNTDEVMQMLRERFPSREVYVYPDPTGAARKTSAAGQTDHGIIRKWGFKCISPKHPWAVKDRLNSTNWLIKNAEGTRRMFVHPRCKDLIKSFKSTTFKEGSQDFVIDKSADIEHWIDGTGYLILSAMNQVKPWKTGSGKSRQAQVY
jgi:phage terminase large subunit